MRILIVHPCKGFYGGAEEVVVQLCKYLETKGHGVILVTKNNPKQLETWIKCPKPSNWFNFREIVGGFSKGADVICCFNFPATLAAFPTKKPTVWYCNEPPELFTNWKRKPIEAFNRWWVRKSKMKVVVADEVQARRFKSIYGVEPTVIPYGVDYNFWSQEPEIRTFEARKGGGGKILRLLQVGTITPYKNQLESLCVLAELVASGIDATLTLAGSYTADTAYFMELQDHLGIMEEEQPGMWKRISYIGQIKHEQVRELFNNHNVLLHPVRGQGGWLVPFEAMCAGLPVVVSPEFTGADLIREHHLGIVEDLAYGVRYMRDMYLPFPEDIKEQTKEWVKENLTWEKYGEGMLKVFKEVINANPRIKEGQSLL